MTDGTHTPYERHPTAKERPRDAADPTRDRSLHSNVNVTWFSSILATNSFRASSRGRDPDTSPRCGRTPGTGRPGPRAAPIHALDMRRRVMETFLRRERGRATRLTRHETGAFTQT